MSLQGFCQNYAETASRRGFTLAELLIALAILGVIATFTIPKVLSSQQISKKKAVFREVIATISQVQHNALADGTIDNQSNYELYSSKINATKLCSTASDTSGCWPQASFSASEVLEGGLIMHNGATIAGLNGNVGADNFMVDWNGPEAPNVAGDDQILLSICYKHDQAWCMGRKDFVTVVTSPGWGGGAAHVALWDWIFQ